MSALTQPSLKPNAQVSKFEYFAYFCYGFGQCFCYGVVGSFILIYYTDVLGISSLVASLIFLIARLWDAVFDPIVSGFMDKKRSTSGKFRKYMKFAPIFVVVSTFLCFVDPNVSMGGKIFFAGATYVLWGTCYAFSDIPFWSMSTVMSNDGQTRTNLVTTASLGVAAGIGFVATIFPLMLTHFKREDSPSSSYLISVAIVLAIGLAFMIFGWAFTKERVVGDATEKITTKDIIAAVKANKYMGMILVVFFLRIFMELVNGIIVYFFTYNLGDVDLMSIFGLISTATALGYFAIPALTKRYPKIQILRALLIIDILLRVIFWFVGFNNITMVFVFLGLTQLFYSATLPIISSMLAETIEYSEAKTGNRCEAIVFGGQTFSSKLAIAAAGALVGFILAMIGYKANQTQSPETLNGLFFCISLLPAMGSFLRLLVLTKYDYTEKDFKKCQQIIAERKAAASA